MDFSALELKTSRPRRLGYSACHGRLRARHAARPCGPGALQAPARALRPLRALALAQAVRSSALSCRRRRAPAEAERGGYVRLRPPLELAAPPALLQLDVLQARLAAGARSHRARVTDLRPVRALVSRRPASARAAGRRGRERPRSRAPRRGGDGVPARSAHAAIRGDHPARSFSSAHRAATDAAAADRAGAAHVPLAQASEEARGIMARCPLRRSRGAGCHPLLPRPPAE